MSLFKAQTSITVPNIATILDTIIDYFSAYNMEVRSDGDIHDIVCSLGRARLGVRITALDLMVEAADPAAFNQLKCQLTGLSYLPVCDSAVVPRDY